MMDSPAIKKLSVVISCFNEEENISLYEKELLLFLDNLEIPYELILVDDGSKDGSIQAIRSLKEKKSTVLAAFHPENRGLGAGLRTGFSIASGDAILTLDADLSFHPSQISHLIQAYEPYVDIVMGSPILGRMDNVNIFRSMLSRGVNLGYGLLIQKRLTSTSSIFRLYRAAHLKSLSLECNSFDINAEILFKSLRVGGRVKEVSAVLGRRIHGVSKICISREIKNHLKMFIKVLKWRYFPS